MRAVPAERHHENRAAAINDHALDEVELDAEILGSVDLAQDHQIGGMSGLDDRIGDQRTARPYNLETASKRCFRQRSREELLRGLCGLLIILPVEGKHL